MTEQLRNELTELMKNNPSEALYRAEEELPHADFIDFISTLPDDEVAVPTHPVTTTFTTPGKDDPRGFIVATFTEWGPQWAWNIQYHLTSDPWHTQHIVTNVFNLDRILDNAIDLRERN